LNKQTKQQNTTKISASVIVQFCKKSIIFLSIFDI